MLSALLDKYADEGISTIENAKVLNLKPFSDVGTPMEIIKDVFGAKSIMKMPFLNWSRNYITWSRLHE